MMYECDDSSCVADRDKCTNRPFFSLKQRTRERGPGVKIIHTVNRGKGLRSTEHYPPGVIILEYTGEVVIKKEALNRADTLYKDNTVGIVSYPMTGPSLII
jgi:hypothetical protein